MRQSQIDLSEVSPSGSLKFDKLAGFNSSHDLPSRYQPVTVAKRYVSLLKLRPMSVVIFSAVIGLLSARAPIEWPTALIAILSIALGGCGSAALNMWFEAQSDARMARTARRVLPQGHVKSRDAMLLGTLMCVSAVGAMAAFVNMFAAGVLAATIFSYFGLYTVAMKPRTVLSVPVGGALAGLLTPLSGWAAASGSINATALVLFAYVFFWTPPHVWSQAIYHMADYKRAGFPMLPAVAGLQAARFWILVFTLAHVVLAELPWLTGDAGYIYLALSGLAGLYLLQKVVVLFRCNNRDDCVREAREFFRVSIYYIVTVLAAVCIDRNIIVS